MFAAYGAVYPPTIIINHYTTATVAVNMLNEYFAQRLFTTWQQ